MAVIINSHENGHDFDGGGDCIAVPEREIEIVMRILMSYPKASGREKEREREVM